MATPQPLSPKQAPPGLLPVAEAGLPPASQVDAWANPPGAYFEQLPETLATRLRGDTSLRGALTQPEARLDILPAPDGYFASFPGRILSRIQAWRPTLRSRLDAVLEAVLAPARLQVALPVLVACLMIAAGLYRPTGAADDDPTFQPRDLAYLAERMDHVTQEELLAELDREISFSDNGFVAEVVAARPAQSIPSVPAQLDDRVVREYLVQSSNTQELIADLQPPALAD